MTLLALLLFLIWYLLRSMYPKYVDFSQVCSGKIAVVGNGPINESDRKFINQHDCVIRFNDEKNKMPHEKTDVLVLRNNALHLASKHVVVLPVIPYCKDITDYLQNVSNLIEPIHVYEPVCKGGDSQTWVTKQVFKDCIKTSRHADSSSGVSSGTALLSRLQDDASVQKVNVFGMNFNGGWWHVDFNDINLTHVCCTKCKFHPTRVNEY